MDIRVQAINVKLTGEDRTHIEGRLGAALDQHAGKVAFVKVTLRDINGPRGGVDQSCKVSVHLNSGEVLHHQRIGEELQSNVSLVADKVKRRVGRHVNKGKSRHVA